MAKLYERFLKVLQNWPVHPEDPTPLRSLAEHIRREGKKSFSARGELAGDSSKCDRRLKSLERLSRGHWFRTYPYNRQTGCLGLTAEQCRVGLSDEYQKELTRSRITSSIRGLIGSVTGKDKN